MIYTQLNDRLKDCIEQKVQKVRARSMASAFHNCFVFLHTDDISFRVDPNHHHLTAHPRLVPAAMLQFASQLAVFSGKISLDLLIKLHVEQPIHFPNSPHPLGLLGQHGSQGLSAITLVHLPLQLPFLHCSFCEQSFLLLEECIFPLEVFLLDAGQTCKTLHYVQHVQTLVFNQGIYLSSEYCRLVLHLLPMLVRRIRQTTHSFAYNREEVIRTITYFVLLPEFTLYSVQGLALSSEVFQSCTYGLQRGGCCFEVLIEAKSIRLYFLTTGCIWSKCRSAARLKALIFGSTATVRLPLMVLMVLRGISFLLALQFDLNFSKAALSSNFKKFSSTCSALSSGISNSLFKNISSIISLFLRCLSSYRLNCPFLAIGGIGIPGCSHSKVILSHSKSEYLRSTVFPRHCVCTKQQTQACSNIPPSRLSNFITETNAFFTPCKAPGTV